MTVHAGAHLSMVAPAGSVAGRAMEFARAEALLSAARAGTGAGLVVCGGPGVGRTRLLAEIAGIADGHGMTVLSGRACALERAFEFGLVRQALGPLVASLPPAQSADLLSGSAAPAGAVLAGAPGVSAEWRADPFPLLNAVFTVLARLAARGPLVVALDDVDLADAPSLRLLAYALRRIRSLPAVIVLTCRAPSVDAQVLATLGDGSEIMELGTLDDGAVAALAKEHLGADPHRSFVDACAEHSGRNPFLLVELLRTLAERGVAPVAAQSPRIAGVCPDSVVRSVVARLWRAGTDAGGLARALAVAGERCELARAARLAGVSERAAGGAADALVAAGIFGAEHPLRFSQPLVANAVRALLTFDQRQRDRVAAATGVVSVLPSRAQLASPGDPVGDALFRRDGDQWSVRYASGASSVRDSKGMRYIAALLAHPGREFAALVLASGVGSVAARGSAAGHLIASDRLGGSGVGDIGDILDPRARTAYRERLADLEAQAEESERFNDPSARRAHATRSKR